MILVYPTYLTYIYLNLFNKVTCYGDRRHVLFNEIKSICSSLFLVIGKRKPIYGFNPVGSGAI